MVGLFHDGYSDYKKETRNKHGGQLVLFHSSLELCVSMKPPGAPFFLVGCSSLSTWEDYLFANWSYLARSGSPIRCSIQLVRGLSTLDAGTLSLSMKPPALGVEGHSRFGSRVGATSQKSGRRKPKLLAKPPWVIDSFP